MRGNSCNYYIIEEYLSRSWTPGMYKSIAPKPCPIQYDRSQVVILFSDNRRHLYDVMCNLHHILEVNYNTC